MRFIIRKVHLVTVLLLKEKKYGSMIDKAMTSQVSSNKKFVKWLAIGGVWTFFAIFFTSQVFLQYQVLKVPIPLWKVISWQFFSGYVWFGLTPLILWLAHKFPLESGKLLRNIPLHLLFSLLVSVFQQSVDAFMLPKLGYPPGSNFPDYWTAYKFFLGVNLHLSVGIYWAIVAISLAVNYYRKFREREITASQLEARLAQTRLQVLKFQLQPHFLFNTLNTISELIYKDQESAEQMITNLSDLLRLSLEKLEVQEVSLQQELDFLKKYVEIEQMRFHDRLTIEMDVAPDTLDAKVPNMILQPLVENAIKHGIAPLSQGGTVKIVSERSNGDLRLTVSDNGIGLTNTDISTIPEGVGLKNTKSRLKHLYGGTHKFEIFPLEKGVRLNLTIPFHTTNEN
jgi:two-component system, LytTR family, sensor kinase